MVSTPTPPFSAYRGPQRHCFVCYAHVDAAPVYAAIAHLHAAGVPVYYDEGIAPAAAWQDELVRAIECAGVLLFFVSAGSQASQHCANEVAVAQSCGIPLLPVFLDDQPLRGGLRLALATTQGLHRQRWDADGFHTQLLDAITRILQVDPAPATFLVTRLDTGRERDRSELDLHRQFNHLLAGLMITLGGREIEDGSRELRSLRFADAATALRAALLLQAEFDTLTTGLGEPRPALAQILLNVSERDLGVTAQALLAQVPVGALYCTAEVIDAIPVVEGSATPVAQHPVGQRSFSLLRVDAPRPARVLTQQVIIETDVRRFNELGALDVVERFINAYQNVVEREARRYGGVIRRTEFDSILLSFDAGQDVGQDAAAGTDNAGRSSPASGAVAALACCASIATHWQQVAADEHWQQHHIKFLGTVGTLLFVRGFVLGRGLERIAELNQHSRSSGAPECEFLLADGRLYALLGEPADQQAVGPGLWLRVFERG